MATLEDRRAIDVYGNLEFSGTLELRERDGVFDVVNVSEKARMNGELQLSLTADFRPALGSTYTILTAENIEGGFSIRGYYQGGDTYLHPVYHENSVELKAFTVGDSNQNGFVDGADYTKWADNYLEGTSGGVWQGDFNGDGVVDGADYTLWADHYTGDSSAAMAVAVPEPGTLLLAAIGAAIVYGWRRSVVLR
jgi:hypothetical protein